MHDGLRTRPARCTSQDQSGAAGGSWSACVPGPPRSRVPVPTGFLVLALSSAQFKQITRNWGAPNRAPVHPINEETLACAVAAKRLQLP